MAELYSVCRFRGLDEWAIRARRTLVEIRRGARDTKATCETIERTRCARPDPLVEMKLRQADKLDSGFLYDGPGDLPNDRLGRVDLGDAPRLNLQWVPRGPVPRSGFTRVIEHFAERVRAPGNPLHKVADVTEDALELRLPCGQGRSGVWQTEENRVEDPIRIRPRTVHEGRSALPVLLLQYLRERCPGALDFALDPDHASKRVYPALRLALHDYWLGDDVTPYDGTRPLAIALGMAPAPTLRLRPLPMLADCNAPPPPWF